MVFSLIMLSLSAFFILFFVTWNRKTLKHQEKIHELKTQNQRALLGATIEGQEEERKRLAENLHDDIGPLLSSLKLQARNLSKDPSKYDDFQSTLNAAIHNIKRVSQKLSPLVFEELGLNKAIMYSCSEVDKIANFSINLDWEEEIVNHLPKTWQLSCFRIIQEAINNTLKHAQANCVKLTSNFEGSLIKIVIEDDGIGICEDKDESEHFGLGINNMEARAESMNANLIISSLNPGTKITLIIPKQNINEKNQDSNS